MEYLQPHQPELLEDPYSGPLYNSIMQLQEKPDIREAPIPDKTMNEESQSIRVEISLELIPGSVRLTYNKDALLFSTKNRYESFRRLINTFFITKGFFLENILKPVEIFYIASFLSADKGYWLCYADENFFSKEEAQELNLLIVGYSVLSVSIS